MERVRDKHSDQDRNIYSEDLDELSSRQKEVLNLLCSGLSVRDTANQLDCKIGTVRTHLRRIADRFDVPQKSRKRWWYWLESEEAYSGRLVIPKKLRLNNRPLDMDTEDFKKRYSGISGIYPLEDLERSKSQMHTRLYMLLWMMYTPKEVAEILKCGKSTIQAHVGSIKSHFRENTDFSNSRVIALRIGPDDLSDRTPTSRWVETQRVGLNPLQRAIACYNNKNIVQVDFTHDQISEVLDRAYGYNIPRRTISYNIQKVASVDEMIKQYGPGGKELFQEAAFYRDILESRV
jgi:DNA-binding CsgD family transcriptional regulator